MGYVWKTITTKKIVSFHESFGIEFYTEKEWINFIMETKEKLSELLEVSLHAIDEWSDCETIEAYYDGSFHWKRIP